MTARTINYDKHVKNLIDELDRTGHVTNKAYKKTSVTFHHNGGRQLSHEAILNIWKSRPASAHFDVDVHGALAQYVRVMMYAWAVGNTEGNMRTISIELANFTAGPHTHWEVAEDTWKSGARLAGWLFARVIGEAPTRHNVFLHDHWSQTSCPGPYVHAIYEKLLNEVQRWYRHFHAAPARSKVQRIQSLLELKDDNRWGKVTDNHALLMRNASRAHAGRPHNVRQHFDVDIAQRIIDVRPDGDWGPKSQAALHAWIKSLQHVLDVHVNGYWDATTDNVFLQLRKRHLIRS